jgi:hypothetical protein
MTSGAALDLADLAAAYALRTTPPADPATFRHVVGEYGPLSWLSGLCLLLYGADTDLPASVPYFCLQTAPKLLSQLNRSTEQQRVTDSAGVRGRIDWSSTLKARCSENISSTVFVYHENNRVFDRPENQLVKLLLDRVQRCLNNIPVAVWTWRAWGGRWHSQGHEPLGVGGHLALLAHRTRVLGGHISLRNVALPETAADRQLAAAQAARNPVYGQVVETYLLYRSVMEAVDWDCWRTVVEATLPLPRGSHGVAEALTGEESRYDR